MPATESYGFAIVSAFVQMDDLLRVRTACC